MSTLQDWAIEEQENLWGDLTSALRYAANGKWSIACEHVIQRLTAVIPLVGPTAPGDVDWILTASGIYDTVLSEADVAIPEYDLAGWEPQMERYGGKIEDLKAKYADTRSMIEKM